MTKPILFSSPMVRAILDGRKSMTRRVVKDIPDCFENLVVESFMHEQPFPGSYCYDSEYPEDGVIKLKDVYQPGDKLWVRETWAKILNDEGCIMDEEPCPGICEGCHIEYKADTGNKHPGEWPEGEEDAPHWRPSIFMPGWASRITLEVVNVRVERLQEITEEDVVREGVRDELKNDTFYPAVYNFRTLWDSINGKKRYGYKIDPDTGKRYRYEKPCYPWDSNPFVWVVEFKRVR